MQTSKAVGRSHVHSNRVTVSGGAAHKKALYYSFNPVSVAKLPNSYRDQERTAESRHGSRCGVPRRVWSTPCIWCLLSKGFWSFRASLPGVKSWTAV